MIVYGGFRFDTYEINVTFNANFTAIVAIDFSFELEYHIIQAWTEITQTIPISVDAARASISHAIAGDQWFLWGGECCGVIVNDTEVVGSRLLGGSVYSLDLSTLEPSGSANFTEILTEEYTPPPHGGPGLVYIPGQRVMMVYGGSVTDDGLASVET